MAVSLKIKRGTRTQLNAAAAAGGLKAGEPYLITDENRIAIGLSTTTYEVFAKSSELGTSWNANNDGAGSGLDADLLDGQHGSSYHSSNTAVRVSRYALFNGSGTVGLIRSFGVSSITDNGTGDYTINFSSTEVTSDYGVSIAVGWTIFGTGRFNVHTRTQSSVRIQTAGGAAAADYTNVSVMVFV